MTPFLLCWPILNSMTPFFTFLKSWMTPLFIISFYPIVPLFLQSHNYPGSGPVWLKHTTCIKVVCKFSKWFTPITSELFLSLIKCVSSCFTCLSSMTPFLQLVTKWPPSLAGFLPQWPYFYFTWYGMAWFLLGLFTEWRHILESTHFTW